tara:strand:- start:198 stop:740 length:543 start_codon:yes stop_codon:yes gene_type:complete
MATPATNLVTTYMGIYAASTDYSAAITAGAEIDLDMTIGDVTVEAGAVVVASTNVMTSTTGTAVGEVIALPSGQDLTLTQGEETVQVDASITATTNLVTSTTGTVAASSTAVTIQTTNLISSTLGDVSLAIDVTPAVSTNLLTLSQGTAAVYAWTDVDDSVTTIWTPVDDSVTMTWKEAA